MTRRCTRWERWLPGNGGGHEVLNWNLHLFQLLRHNSSFGLNILGPLCLWQCFFYNVHGGNKKELYHVSVISMLGASRK